MNIIDCEQGTSEWFDAKRGKVSASRIADLVLATKSGYSTSRANYAAEIIAERLTGTTKDGFTNAAMEWGTLHEPLARATYELMTDRPVTQVGLVIHPTIDLSCCSPDGLACDDGLIEIKCPNTATHITTLQGGSIDGKYQKQMQWQMACTGRAWCDFVSFDPRLPAEMQLHIKRVERDAATITGLEAEVRQFLNEIGATLDDLQKRYPPAREDAA